MTFTTKELQEMEEFDYAALILEDIKEDEVLVETPSKIYPSVKVTPTTQDMRHHMARLEMMMAQERGEDLSYEEALK